MSELNKIALKIISNGKGILAADESNGTMTKRLEAVNVTSNPENRLLFRETIFSAESMKECIGGVILYDETINQITSFGKSIPELISSSGAIFVYPPKYPDLGKIVILSTDSTPFLTAETIARPTSL